VRFSVISSFRVSDRTCWSISSKALSTDPWWCALCTAATIQRQRSAMSAHHPPKNAAIATGKDLHHIAQRDTNLTAGRHWRHHAVESISLLVANLDDKIRDAFKLIAAKGNILAQAQSGNVDITADRKIAITACKENLTATAGKEFLLQSGGGYIRISGGNVEIYCPGTLSMKAKNFVHVGGGAGAATGEAIPIKPGIMDVPIIGDVIDGALDVVALAASPFRNDGLAVQPFTGKILSKQDVQDAKFGVITGGGASSTRGIASVGRKISDTLKPSSFVTEPNKALFWSGLGKGGDKIAADAATSRGKTTLEQLVQKNEIEMPVWNAESPESVAAWANASKYFAEGASGQVKFVSGDKVRPGSIWESIELPTLKSSPDMSEIIHIDHSSGIEESIFVRD
jgi:hypothetical protein